MVADDSEIARYIYDHEGVTPEELADTFAVSVRTVRYYIKHSNDAMAGFARIAKVTRGGYHVKIEDQVAFDRWLDSIRTHFSRSNMTPHDRVNYLLSDLLARTDWVTVDELCRVLYISRPTVTSDLREVEKKLKPFNLKIEKRPRYGIRVEGNEMGRRLCLASSVVESLAPHRDAADGAAEGAASEIPAMVPLDQVAAVVDKALLACDYDINSLTYQNLLVHISIALMRMREGNYVPMEPGAESLEGTRALEAARHVAKGIEEEFGATMPDSEVVYIAIHLAGKESLANAGSEGDKGDGQLVIDDEVWDAVTEMLNVVWSSFRYDFRNDLELRMNLARHIVPLSVRLKYHMQMDNPILTDIRNRYPLAYAMAIDSSAVLARRYGAMPSENEAGYIAMAFALALERHRTELPRKNILIVCASGLGSARLLEHRYRELFGPYLNKIITTDVNKVGQFDFSGIDYVFTTVPLHDTVPVPVRMVNLFLNDADAASVRNVLKDEVPNPSRALLERRFPAELFFAHVPATGRLQVIDYLCDKMIATGRVSDSFRKLVYRREAFTATAFGNGVAMPHPLEPVCDEAFVAVAMLDKPIDWSGNEVRAVFLIAVSTEDNEKMSSLYGMLATLFSDEDDMKRLIETPTRELLFGLLHP